MPKFKADKATIQDPLEFTISGVDYTIERILPERLDRVVELSKQARGDDETGRYAKLIPKAFAILLSDSPEEEAVIEEDLSKADVRELYAAYDWFWSCVNDAKGKKETAGK